MPENADRIESDKVYIAPPGVVRSIRFKKVPAGSTARTKWRVKISCGCEIVTTVMSLADSVMMADDLPEETKRCGRGVDCSVQEYRPKEDKDAGQANAAG